MVPDPPSRGILCSVPGCRFEGVCLGVEGIVAIVVVVVVVVVIIIIILTKIKFSSFSQHLVVLIIIVFLLLPPHLLSPSPFHFHHPFLHLLLFPFPTKHAIIPELLFVEEATRK